ncbi:ACT domain-containing protein [Oxyplasma meridianum]|uniref:ACT domain-containing protein n=1 Tax=Oxyplasma meridianum TaxID=3073602 RepID=A0AAX4NG19_9ARCH
MPKASISFSLPNNGPGSLVSALKPLSDRKINLSMIVSRPDKNIPGSYRFFIDCIEFSSIENLDNAIGEMKKAGILISMKGIYQPSNWMEPDY